MAWTAPRTWASGEIPTAAQLNTDLRDNLNELSRHAHGGGSGSGTAALGNLVSMTFIDAAAPSAPGGTLTRVYSSSTGLFWRNAGGIFSAGAASHEHSVAYASLQGGAVGTGGTAGAAGVTLNHFGALGTAGTFSTFLTQPATVGGTGSRAVFAYGQISLYNANVGNSTGIVRFSNAALASTTTSSMTWTGLTCHSQAFIIPSTNVAAGAGTWILEVLGSSGGSAVFIVGLGIVVQEVRQA